ncbi:MAG: PEP-CTERM sorting domain-containing protein [Verrucomicrobiales bacterium]|nr:PEP-CTERM sorting domain-containing protein [Verrucomicrobiales bacterium]
MTIFEAIKESISMQKGLNILYLYLGLAAIAACVVSVHADELLTYKTPQSSGGSTGYAATVSGAYTDSLTASSLSFTGFTVSGVAKYGTSTIANNIYVRSSGFGDAASNYLSFTVTPETGYAMNLDSININFGATTGGGVPKARFSYTLYSSMDDYQNVIASGTYTASDQQNDFVPNLYTVALDSTGLMEDVTFRISFDLLNFTGVDGAIARIGQGSDRTYGIQLNGSVTAIPEPSTALLLTVGAVVLLGTFMVKRQPRNINRGLYHEN